MRTFKSKRHPESHQITGRRILLMRFFASLRMTIFLIVLMPFLVGFSPLSAVKNEEGNKLYKKGQVGKAKTAYQSALNGQPKSPEIAFNLGNAYYREESFKDSQDFYKAAAKDEKSPALQSKAFYNLGNTLFRGKELDKAAEFYKQALRFDPQDQDAKHNLELLMKEQEEQKKNDQKQDQKKDQKKQNDQNQKDQQQNQGGGQGQQKDQKDNKDNQQGQGQQSQGGQDKQDSQKDQNKNPSEGESQKEEGQDHEKQGQNQEKDKNEQKDKASSGGQSEQDQKDQGKSGQTGQPKEGQQQEDQSEGEGEEKERPKTPEQMRAEQLLGALEDQEKQVLRVQRGGNKNGSPNVRRYVEKDW